MSSYLFCVLCGLAAPADGVSFINDVAPILKENCFACHNAKKKSGKLEMTSYATLRAGGANDDPIVPGKPQESELINVLTGVGDRQMPPKDKGGPLPPQKIAVIERWVREGAQLDPGIDAKADLLRELRTRWQPPAPPTSYPAPPVINAVAFSPDGQSLVIGGYYEITVWDVKSSELRKRLRTRSERTYGLAFLPNGQLVAAAGRPGQEGDLRIYDLNVPGVIENKVERLDGVSDPKVLIAHLFDTDDCFLCLAVSKDGNLIAAGGCDRTARVWNISSGPKSAELVATVATHADWVLGVGFGGDNRFLLTAGRDKTAKSFDLVKKESVLNFADHQAVVHGIAVRKDDKLAYTVGADKSLRLWKVDGDGKPVRSIGGHGDEVIRVTVHPTQPFVVTASADKTVRIWKEDGGAVKTLSGLTEVPFALCVSPDGSLIAAGGYGGVVKIWKFPSGEPVTTFIAAPGYSDAVRNPKP